MRNRSQSLCRIAKPRRSSVVVGRVERRRSPPLRLDEFCESTLTLHKTNGIQLCHFVQRIQIMQHFVLNCLIRIHG